MIQTRLLNPDGKLLTEIEQRLRVARKSQPLWAKRLDGAQDVVTLEGVTSAAAGDYLCRGILGEFWAQQASRLFARYAATAVVDEQGFERFDPLAAATVEAAPVDTAFRVLSRWGELTGKPHDYLVRSTMEPSDIWIVAGKIFATSYNFTTE